MRTFLREDSRKTPAPKRQCNSPAENGSADDASEICFSLDRSDPCAFGVTVQSAESCEISGPLCTVQPMETCETPRIDPPVPPPYPRTLFWLSSACYTLFGQDGVWWCDFEAGGDMPVFSPVPPPAPSSAGLLTRDWKSSQLRSDDDGYYLNASCQWYEDEGEDAPICCPFHNEFYDNNPDFYENEDFTCDDDNFWEVPEPAPMTKEQLKAAFPYYLNAWSTHIDGHFSNALSTLFSDWLNSRGLSFEALQVPIAPPCPSKPLTGHCSIGYKLTFNKKTGFLLFLAKPHEGANCFCPRQPTKWWYDV